MPDETKYFGKDYTIDFIRFKGSSLVLQALAADQVDVGVLAFSTFATGIVNANLPIEGIADVAQDGPSFSTIYGVLDSSPIKSVKDLERPDHRGQRLRRRGRHGGAQRRAQGRADARPRRAISSRPASAPWSR